MTTPALSVVIPVHNEAGNIGPLISEVARALDGVVDWEAVVVDDHSSDSTPGELAAIASGEHRVRIVRHARNAGQSTALHTGVRFARGEMVVTLDGDGQNDPADIPRLLALYHSESNGSRLLVTGHRATRRDTWLTRASSRIANLVRGSLLGDRTPDTGCGLKLFPRELFLSFPSFDHMHRFLPALAIRAGGRVVTVPVGHRPRARGKSHYGVHNRLWVGIVDLFGVIWLMRRSTEVEVLEQKEMRDEASLRPHPSSLIPHPSSLSSRDNPAR